MVGGGRSGQGGVARPAGRPGGAWCGGRAAGTGAVCRAANVITCLGPGSDGDRPGASNGGGKHKVL